LFSLHSYFGESDCKNCIITTCKCVTELRNNEEIIIKPADKGGAVVVMQKELYRQQAMRQLNNRKYYEPLDFPIYVDTAYKIYQVLNRMRHNGDISAKQMAYLKPDLSNITPRYFYLLPKIHKPRPSCHTLLCQPADLLSPTVTRNLLGSVNVSILSYSQYRFFTLPISRTHTTLFPE